MLTRKLELDLCDVVTLGDLQELVRAAEQGGASASDTVVVERDENDEVARLSLSLPARPGG